MDHCHFFMKLNRHFSLQNTHLFNFNFISLPTSCLTGIYPPFYPHNNMHTMEGI